MSDLVRTADAATAHAVELAALREELAETREMVDRVARTLDQLASRATRPGSGQRPERRDVERGKALDVDGEPVPGRERQEALQPP